MDATQLGATSFEERCEIAAIDNAGELKRNTDATAGGFVVARGLCQVGAAALGGFECFGNYCETQSRRRW